MKYAGRFLKIIFLVYVSICILLYLFQEKLIFFPEKLDKNYQFQFNQPFREITINTHNHNLVNGLLFQVSAAKGLIFYLHGNAGSLSKWGAVASRYTELGYDIFILDYPGYGKSTGQINGENNLFEDIQDVYNEMKSYYPENKIIILGYSIGTGPAAKLASANHPRLLILQAPYYNLTDMMHHYYPVIPAFILKYKFETSEYVKHCNMPVVLFHGDADEVIYYESSVKLRKLLKNSDTLITLHEMTHNGITDNPEYINAIKHILE
jgi:pimeloyl-ACP methyl ester carboxylesterase